MKKAFVTLGICFVACVAHSQTSKDVKLSDLQVKPSNPNGPGKPDPKPADVKPSVSPAVKDAVKAYESVGSPKPIMEGTKPVGVQVTVPN